MSDSGRDGSVILKIEDVAKSFEGVRALDGVGFTVRTNEIKALIGPNGAGKTTMLNIINGFLKPDMGSVVFEGRELVGRRPDRTAMLGVSRTFQLIRLFTVNSATVLDNVLLGAHRHFQPTVLDAVLLRRRTRRREAELKEKAMDLLDFVGMSWAAEKLPGELSFGNQRMVELARSLMSDPVLLLLDEPASGLNDTEVEAFMKLLSLIRDRGITILLVEHNMKVVMNISDDIVVLDFGRWLAEGDPATISRNPKVIEAYLGAEAPAPGGAH
jgi:branched-chain amino acid transport system ATP-binding protein